MQKELDAMGLPVTVGIMGVNAIGHESQNAAACNGRDIPWLQETVADPAWSKWGAEYRDVVILDEANVRTEVYNLTEHDLNLTANYEELKAKLIAAAGGQAAR